MEPTNQVIANHESWWRKLLRMFVVGILILAMWAGCLWLYSRNNSFSIAYHPDEPGKVEQVVEGYRNYLHPLLLLETTSLWLKLKPVNTDNNQLVVMAGRDVSAFFGATAAALLTLTAYLCAGWWGLILGALLLGLCPPLLVYSHYMKEDASLVVGLAVTILATRMIWMSRRWWTRIPCWALLAAGCALATSGKYVGAMTLVLPVALFFIAPGFRWWRPILRILLFVPILVVCLVAINHRALNLNNLDIQKVMHDPDGWEYLFTPGFLNGLNRETRHSSTEHLGMTAHRPNNYALRQALSDTWPWGALPLAALPLVLLLTRRQGWGWEVLLLLFTAFCTLVLSYSIILFPRYVLPLVVLIHLAAALTLARLLVAMRGRPVAQATAGICTGLILLVCLFPRCLDYTYQFGHDARETLQEWAIKNLPANARVYCDNYTAMAVPLLGENSLRNLRPDVRVYSPMFAASVGSLTDLARYGECYVVICQTAYDRYFEPSAMPAMGNEDEILQMKSFYQTLLEKYVPVWQSVPAHYTGAFANPDIKVYRLKRESGRP